MEGNFPSVSWMLAQYHNLKEFLKKKLHSTKDTDYIMMLETMISKTEAYLNEALGCDIILLSTALNPCYRLSIFKMWFPSHEAYVQEILQSKYEQEKKNKSFPMKKNHQLQLKY